MLLCVVLKVKEYEFKVIKYFSRVQIHISLIRLVRFDFEIIFDQSDVWDFLYSEKIFITLGSGMKELSKCGINDREHENKIWENALYGQYWTHMNSVKMFFLLSSFI